MANSYVTKRSGDTGYLGASDRFWDNGYITALYAGTISEAVTDAGVTIDGVVILDGTVDGRDIATDGTKLDGIEASADVTDATNVAAAGATMSTDTDVSSASWFLDEDDMASDSATKVASQQSVKAYVDSSVSSSADNLMNSLIY